MVNTLILFILLYFIGIVGILWGFYKLPKFTLLSVKPKITFSIIVVFKDEATHLESLLNTLLKIEYPPELFEIIFVDDFSEDHSVTIIESHLNKSAIHYKILQNKRYSNSPKKDAITLAVNNADHSWIVCTDADCKVPSLWLKNLNDFIISTPCHFVAMPVLCNEGINTAQKFQFWDFISLQMVTMASFGWQNALICNGANMAFKKDCFFEVNGYEQNNDVASGDDVFLMEKLKQLDPTKLHYLKTQTLTVLTQPQNSWQQIIQQRIRWASKTKKIKNIGVWLLGLWAFLGNLLFIVGVLGIFIKPLLVFRYLTLFMVKVVLDALVLKIGASFFKKSFSDLYLSTLIYPFIFFYIFIKSLKGSYIWKGKYYKT